MRENVAAPVEPLGRQGAYLAKKCFEAATKDNMPVTYPVELKLAHSPFTESLLTSGLLFEEEIGRRLTAEVIDQGALAIVTEAPRAAEGRTWEARQQKETDTWNAYRNPAVRFIFNARIGGHFESLLSEYLSTPTTDVNRISEPDAIELGPYLPNGLRAMRFIDVKDHKTTSGKSKNAKDYYVSPLSAPFFDTAIMEQRPFFGTFNSDDWMQLSHYYSHGQSLGLTDVDHSLWAAVIGREAMLVWARLDEVSFLNGDNGSRTRMPVLEIYRNAFAHGIRVSLNARQRDVVPSTPSLSAPERKEECRQCPWRKVCTSEMKAYDDGAGHITLLPGVTPLRAKAYYDVGVSSIKALAALHLREDIKGIKDTDIIQARVTQSGRVHKAHGIGSVEFKHADIEVDFDCENDAQYYMWGIRTTFNTEIGTMTNVRTYDDYTETNELGVFLSAWNYFRSVLEFAASENKTVQFYYYSHYEATALKKLASRYVGQPGVPTVSEVEQFYASDQVTDMRPIMEKQLIWPTESHSLKVLANHAGFSWRDETPGGDESMVWYRASCSDADPLVRAASIDRLRKYNEDDTEAQIALRNWIQSNEGSFISADKI